MADAYAAKYAESAKARKAMARFVKANAIFVLRPERAFGIIERAPEFSTRATKWVWP
jgi:hypothetical protein